MNGVAMEAVKAEQPQPASELSREAWQRFIEAGFLACDAGLHSMATALFADLVKLRTDIPQLVIYQAMAHLQCGNVVEAEAVLSALRQRFPDSQMAKAVFAVCRMLLDEPDGAGLLDEVIADGSERDAVEWAQLFVEQARRQSRAVPTPALPLEGMEFFRHFNRK